ncbi:hypothetical protein EYF80_041234 [Liparis tanakae]|uniref:Uncharacterized protein n=1 Tax=Liparis tanakae TaxID=230148 RepID=A0A4Z2G7N0_9TELE|nr:hypothetical protein EYF80_041234 [Liparis tanakae]
MSMCAPKPPTHSRIPPPALFPFTAKLNTTPPNAPRTVTPPVVVQRLGIHLPPGAEAVGSQLPAALPLFGDSGVDRSHYQRSPQGLFLAGVLYEFFVAR